MVLAGAELLSRATEEAPPRRTWSAGDTTYQEACPRLGVRLKRGGRYTVDYDFESHGKFQVRYTLDGDRKRHTPLAGMEERRRFLALFGDSMVFGVAVDDDQTIPCHVGNLYPDVAAYNYGEPGCAMPHMWHRLKHEGLDIPQRKGVGAYLYFSFHADRVMGKRGEGRTPWGRNRPGLVLERDGGLRLAGPLPEVYKIRFAWYEWTQNIRLVRSLERPFWSAREADIVAATIIESAALFKEQFPEADFKVLVWSPSYKGARPITEEIMRRVRNAGIEVVYLQKAEPGINQWPIFSDGHLPPETTLRLARLIGDVLHLGD